MDPDAQPITPGQRGVNSCAIISRQMKRDGYLILLFLGAGIELTALGMTYGKLARQRWPRVPAVVESSGVEPWKVGIYHQRYRPMITFSYSVDGVSYRSNSWDSIDQQDWNEGAREIVRRYPVGAAITAAYHPGNPGDAFIEETRTWGVIAYFAIGGLISIYLWHLGPRLLGQTPTSD